MWDKAKQAVHSLDDSESRADYIDKAMAAPPEPSFELVAETDEGDEIPAYDVSTVEGTAAYIDQRMSGGDAMGYDSTTQETTIDGRTDDHPRAV